MSLRKYMSIFIDKIINCVNKHKNRENTFIKSFLKLLQPDLFHTGIYFISNEIEQVIPHNIYGITCSIFQLKLYSENLIPLHL